MKKIKFIIALAVMLLLSGCGEQKSEIPVSSEKPSEKPAEKLYISEIMAKNKSYISNENFEFPDWIELYNEQGESLELGEFRLVCGDKKQSLPSCSIEAGEYKLIFLDNENRSFSLPSDGAELMLENSSGAVCDVFTYERCPVDKSLVKLPDGTIALNEKPSPGFENTYKGYRDFINSREIQGPLIINEAMSSNKSFRFSGKTPDWFEIKNISQQEIQLENWTVEDIDGKKPFKFPEKVLAPGEVYLILCDGEKEAEFSLNSKNDGLFLYNPQGLLVDYLNISSPEPDHSQGRDRELSGSYYFKNPSPGEENSEAFSDYAPMPEALSPEGIFENCSGTEAVLNAEENCRIHYTLDGSIPDENSLVYSGPVEIQKSSVMMARCYKEGCIESPVLSLSFIINESHDLPVLSIVSDKKDFKTMYTSPDKDIVTSGSISFFSPELEFKTDCGIKLHGATSKVAQKKKSMKLQFKNSWDGPLHYDLFNNGVDEFSSLVLRSAQEDVCSSQLRDVLMHELASRCCPELSRQDYRYCSVYIDGNYQGLYALREAHSAEHYAAHHDVSTSDVKHFKGQWDQDCKFNEVYRFILSNDMSNPENYAYVQEHLDIESFIAWDILQAYSGNFDINAPNVRYNYIDSQEKISIAFVDLDLGFSNFWDCFKMVFYPSYNYEYGQMNRALLKSPEFCKQFISQMQEYFAGPLKEENVIKLIDELSDEIRSEISADYSRWDKPVSVWENMVQSMKDFVLRDGGRTKALTNSIKNYINISDEEYISLFGED